MAVINMTPHPIKVVLPTGEIVIPPVGIVVRAKVSYKEAQPLKVGGYEIPVQRAQMGSLKFLRGQEEVAPDELPAAEVVIVPQLLAPYAQQLKELLGVNRVLAPDTARAVRDDRGRIIGVPGFIELG